MKYPDKLAPIADSGLKVISLRMMLTESGAGGETNQRRRMDRPFRPLRLFQKEPESELVVVQHSHVAEFGLVEFLVPLDSVTHTLAHFVSLFIEL